jgi:hypothetical protein
VRGVEDLGAVAECDALNDFGQLVFTLKVASGFRGGGYKLEDHQPGGLLHERAFGPPPVGDMLRHVRPQHADRLRLQMPQVGMAGEELPVSSQEVEKTLLLARPTALTRMRQDAYRTNAA